MMSRVPRTIRGRTRGYRIVLWTVLVMLVVQISVVVVGTLAATHEVETI